MTDAALLYVSDHRVAWVDGEPFTSTTFDQSFFQPFLEVFPVVHFVGRRTSPSSARRNFGLPRDSIRHVRPELPAAAHYAIGAEVYRLAMDKLVRRYDAVFVRLPSILGVVAARAAHRAGIPYAFDLAGDPAESLQQYRPRAVTMPVGAHHRRQVREVVRGAETGSYVTRSRLQEHFPVMATTPTWWISNATLDVEAFRTDDEVAATPPPRRDRLRLISVGNLVPVKNTPFLLDVVLALQARGANASLDVYGDGPLRAPLEREIARRALGQSIRLRGYVSEREHLRAALDAADIFLLPSLSEGLPRALVEAMARGLLCVGARRGGITELLPDDSLFEPTAPPQICADQILRIVATDVYARRAENIRTARSFSLAKMTSSRIALLRTLRAASAR